MARRVWGWRHSIPLLVIGGAVVAANALYFFGVLDQNPINLDSGLAAITHAGPLAGSPWLDPNTGITSQALGHLVAESWLHGHVPWWNPYEGLGSPLAGEMQSGALFPPTLLLVWAHGQVLLHALLELTAGLATYALLLELRVGRLAATCGGIAFALCGAFAWFSHAPIEPICFLPVVLLGIERAANGSRARGGGWRQSRGWLLIAVGLALSLYAGFPETAYLDGLFGTVFALTRLVALPAGQRRAFVLTLAAGVGLALLLAAPILTAFLDYLPAADLGGHAGLFGRVSLPKAAAPQAFMPYLFGPINGFSDPGGGLTFMWDNVGGYLGLPLVVLGAVGAFSKRHRVLAVVLVLWLVLVFGRTFGIDGPMQLFNLLPGMKDVAVYRYADATTTMAAVLLACIGLDDLVAQRVPRRRTLLAGALGLVVVALSLLGSRRLLDRISGDHRPWEYASIGWALLVVAVIMIGAVVVRGRVGGMLVGAVVALDAVAMFVVPQLSAPQSAALYLQPAQYLAADIGTSRFYTVRPIAPNYGSYFGIASLRMDDVPEPKAAESYLTSTLGLAAGPFAAPGPAVAEFITHLAAFEQAGVKYLVTPGDFTLPADAHGLHLVFSGPSADIFEVPQPGGLYAAPGCTRSDQQLTSVTVHCRTATMLVRREVSMRGWSATVNGHADAVTTSGPFQQVWVPGGTAVVVFSFSPPHMDLALLALVLGLLGAVLVVVSQRRARRSTRPDPQQSLVS